MLAAAQRKPFSRLLAHDRVRAVLLAWVVLAALLLVLPAVAGGADTKEPGTNDVQPLWQGYPLNPGAGRVDRAAVTKRTTPAQPAARGAGDGSSATAPLAVAGGSMLLLAALATLVAVQRRRTLFAGPLMKGVPMSRFMNRRSKDDVADDGSAETAAAPADPEAAPAPGPEPSADARNVGEHVQSVLKAAEDAAARMIEEARTHAEEVRSAADREASVRIETARVESDRLTEEAERAHSEASAAAAEVRAAAEADAAQRRAAADEDAGQLRARAERDAAAYAEDAAGRYDGLLEDTALAEDRLRRLVDGLRDVADRLDDLLEPDEEEEPAEEASAEPDVTSLHEALDPGASRAGATTG